MRCPRACSCWVVNPAKSRFLNAIQGQMAMICFESPGLTKSPRMIQLPFEAVVQVR